jgi:ubiquinone/menaquinone biosynthesis C-methylase UbiE
MSETIRTPAASNAEAIDAWDGPLFDRFVRFRHLVTTGLGAHGDAALRLYPPPHGGRVLDIGCGFGDMTADLAARVGPTGEAVGVDAAPRFIEAARSETQEAGVRNARFAVADVQSDDLGGPYDMAFSRMGTMFFANPVVALRRVREALVPGARLVMVVWRRREDNSWLYRAQTITEKLLQRPDDHTEPTCGPGPFSMAGADTVSDVLLHAGFGDVALHRCDQPILIGENVDEAVELMMALGPAGEILRLWGERMAHRHDEVRQAIRDGLADYTGGDGRLRAPASTWIVSALAPPA